MQRPAHGPVVAVIPARYASTRFPGKALAELCGKPMVQWVCERAAAATRIDRVLVATDDVRVYDCVEGFGGEAVMTAPTHPTGTDRIAEAIVGVEASVVVNVQGDEPAVPPEVLDELVMVMQREPAPDMATVGVALPADSAEAGDPNVVKVVLSASGEALYFSRAPIPFACNVRPEDAPLLRHWGIYAYRRDFLQEFVTWAQTPLERCESLEQLRALEHGARIRVLRSTAPSIGVDVPADVPRAEALLRQLGEA